MARDLATLKDALWEQFEKARERQKNYSDESTGFRYSNPTIANRQAIAQLAHAIVAVEQEERLQQEAKGKWTHKTWINRPDPQ